MAEQRRGQLIRAFIALPLGENTLPAARSAIRTLASSPQGDAIRWVRPENLHVTLRFLGNIREEDVEALRCAVGNSAAVVPAFDLGIGPPEMFPRSRRPRVVAATLLPEEPLVTLAAAVDRGVRSAGIPTEDRPFRPHLTLGRIQRNAPRSLAGLAGAMDRIPHPTGADPITQVVLFRSVLKPDGPVYTELWAAPLARA